MKLASTLPMILAGVLLASCDKPADAPKPSEQNSTAAAVVKKRQARVNEPIQWDAAQKAFVLNGQPLTTGRLWTFESGTDGFVGAGSTLSTAPGGGLKVTGTIFDPIIRSPAGLAIDGSAYNTILIRISRQKDTARWDGSIFWATTKHKHSGAYVAGPLRGADPQVGETTVMVYDLSKPFQGGDDWSTSTIESLRLDLDDDIGGEFTIHQIAIVNIPGGASPRKPAAPAAAPAAKP
jgi:hypothetical protein